MENGGSCEMDLIQDVMASLGWSNSFVPIASEENRKLLDGIKFLGRSKLERIDALEKQDKEKLRVRLLLTSADNEFDQNLKLLTAHKSHYSTEHHLFKLAEHDESKFKQMLKEMAKELTERNQQQKDLKRKFKWGRP